MYMLFEIIKKLRVDSLVYMCLCKTKEWGNCRRNISSTKEILPHVFKLKKLYREIDKAHRFIKGCYQGRVFKRQSRAKHERVEQSISIIRQSRPRFELIERELFFVTSFNE